MNMLSKLLRNKLLRFIVVTEVLLGGCALVFIAWMLWNRPLGPSMGLENNPKSALAAGLTPHPGQDVQVTPSITTTQTISGTSSNSLVDHLASLLQLHPARPDTVCGGPAVMNLLVIGSDERSHDYQYGLSDSIRLVRVDFVQPGVMALDIPRDLWVEIPGIADHGVDHGKLNQAFMFGGPGMGYYDDQGGGPGLLARTLELNYGVTGIDHYIAMDMTAFIDMIDAVGGIEVYVPYYIDLNQGQDGANPDYVYYPGSYWLDGERALMFARLRAETTIFQRARYQDIILRGLQHKLLSPGIIPELPNLVSQFSGSVMTDLSANDIRQLVCLGEKLTDDNTRIVQFPDNTFTGDSTYDPYRGVWTYTLSVDQAVMRSYFSDFMKGTWPQN